MHRALTAQQVLLLLKALTRVTVPAFVDAFVEITLVGDLAKHSGYARFVSWLRRPNEIIKRDLKPTPNSFKLLFHLVAVSKGI
jgi:hypothetical protein